MKITNKANLPLALVKAVENDDYSKGDADYSTTELNVPSRIVALRKKHYHELEEDVADRIYSLLGKLGHKILENSGMTNFVEKRLSCMVDGFKLSGQVDIIDATTLEDWKFCSRYTAADGVKAEWIQQASTNAYICHHNGIKIDKARYIAIFRDFSKPQARKLPDYPKHQVMAFDVPLWDLDKTERWIKERIASHEKALSELPECSMEERWNKGPKTAVMKPGGKRALRVLDTLSEAQEWAAENATGPVNFEDRPGENVRCMDYCPAVAFCSQAKQLKVPTALAAQGLF